MCSAIVLKKFALEAKKPAFHSISVTSTESKIFMMKLLIRSRNSSTSRVFNQSYVSRSMNFYFKVMIQPHNRHMSFSVYICALAVTDTMSLCVGMCFTITNIQLMKESIFFYNSSFSAKSWQNPVSVDREE